MTVISSNPIERTARLRLVGGDLAKMTEVRKGREAWCEVVVWLSGDGETGGVRSFGGEVWPMAWPDIFTQVNMTTVMLTDRGMEIASAAIDGCSGSGLYA